MLTGYLLIRNQYHMRILRGAKLRHFNSLYVSRVTHNVKKNQIYHDLFMSERYFQTFIYHELMELLWLQLSFQCEIHNQSYYYTEAKTVTPQCVVF